MDTSKKLNQKGIENVGKLLNQILPDFIEAVTSVPGCEILDQFASMALHCYNSNNDHWPEVDSIGSCIVNLNYEPGRYKFSHYVDLAIKFIFKNTDEVHEALKILEQTYPFPGQYLGGTMSKYLNEKQSGLVGAHVSFASIDGCIETIIWYTLAEDEID